MKYAVIGRLGLRSLFVFLVAGGLFAWPSVAHLQSDQLSSGADKGSVENTGKHINFSPTERITVGDNAAGTQAVAMASADFDSDGFADLITADTGGNIALFKGRALVPQKRVDGSPLVSNDNSKVETDTSPFSITDKTASIGFAPDFLFAGDFNADGHADVIAIAKGSSGIVLAQGDGRGNFAQDRSISIDGKIIAAEAGEIGRPDGQTDVAAVYANKNGTFLAVFEHPESAFKHAPEIIKLPSAATAIAIGNTDEDFYSDIAIACGNDLVIVHERGQSYPWDIVKDSGIVRPPPVVEIRKMSFGIVSMAIGRFGERRGTSLALLGNDGNIYHLEAPKTSVSPAAKLPAALIGELKPDPFEPADSNGRSMAMISQDANEVGSVDAYGKPTGNRSDPEDPAQKLLEQAGKIHVPKVDPETVKRQNEADAPRKAAMQERTKAGFIRGISAKTSRLANWEIGQITMDHRFVAMAAGGARLVRAAVSSSPFDDLIVTSPEAGQTELVSRLRDGKGKGVVENTSLEGKSGILDILPMRINLDGLTDFVVLRQGTSGPEVMMTAPAAVFVVNTTDDDGDCNFGVLCSLRDAIRRANSVGGSSTIYFDIPTPTAIISPLSPLPAIIQPVTIQGNHLSNGTKSVEINGVNAGAPVDGLKIRASNAFIYDLAITGFKSQTSGSSQVGGNGIVIESDSARPNNTGTNLLECFLGIDAAGTTAKPNMAAGLLIFDSDDNFITNTVSSGNNTGIAIEGGNTNYVAGSKLGLNAAGTAKVPNFRGMFLAGADNRIGGENQGFANTISGNGFVSNFAPCVGYGIYVAVLADLTTLELLTHDNNISGNKIGTDPTGSVGLGNCWQGINTNPITSTTVGSITESGRNIISGNGWGGIWCEAIYGDAQTTGGFCSIMGNNVGTDITGSYSIYNDAHNTLPISSGEGAVSVLTNYSLSAIGAPGGTTPGGPCTGFCNLVSGNINTMGGLDLASGVEVGGPGIAGIFNNYIGTKRNGIEALGNNFAGIDMASTIVPGAAPIYYAGGHTVDEGSLGNLVAASSSFSGIEVNSNGGPGDYRVLGNKIGTDVSGNNALPNGFGIYVGTWTNNTVEIGDTHALGRNIISGNTSDGIGLGTGFGVKIFNNSIGVSSSNAPLGNGRNGINVGNLITVYNTKIGGTDTASPNIIANNVKAGVKVNSGNILNPIRGNSIYNNGTLGIDLSSNTFFPDGDGVTDNDCLDGDTGANGLQNYPVLLSTVTNGSGQTRVIGYLRSAPSQDFDLDFYSNDIAEPGTNHGEGKVYVGSMSITTNGSGFRSFDYELPPTAFGLITATATDSFGNTSEFSCDVGACTDPVRPVTSKEEVDELYAVSICADPIVVNITSDEDDDDLLDETCDVDPNTAGPQCSLRAAIQEAEHQPGANAITFNIPGGGTHAITPATALPILNQPVSIDASTQPGYSGVPLVVLDGTATTNAYGFAVRGGNSLVRGFAVINFKEQIGISGSAGNGQNRIGGNYVGIHPNGTPGDMARQLFGITLVVGATNNQIGGFRPENRNVIGGTGQGITVSGGSHNNRFNNNYVGIAADGVTPIPNRDGIILLQADQNNIGGYIDDAPNIISFNQESGILISGSSSNRISGNLIGTTSDGNSAAGNKSGVSIDSGSGYNIVGGATATEKNVISGQNATNNSVGVLIKPDAGSSNTVSGNYLGVSLAGDIGLPNRVGIAVNADNQTIGNASESDYRNLIVSADTDGAYGIYLHPFFPNDELTGVTVQNNTIGTLSFNNAASGQLGIYLTGNVKSCTVKGNTVGHQSFAGIRLFDGPHNNTISGNRVGIKTTNAEIPNYNGIAIRQSDTNFVRDNVVSGNINHGIVIGDTFGQNDRPAPLVERESRPSGSSGSFAINNIVTANKIGTDVDGSYVIPNGAVGVGVGENGRDNTIGGVGNLGNIVGGATGDYGIAVFIGTINDSADAAVLPRGNKVIGNHVGVGAAPDNAFLGNRYGIYVRNAVSTVVGGDAASKGNVVGNSEADGIRLFKPGTVDTNVQNNYVGVTPVGDLIANGADGISVDGTGAVTLDGNTVSGNVANGIHLKNLAAPARPNGSIPAPIAKAVGNVLGLLKLETGEFQKVGNGLVGLLAEDVNNVIVGVEGQATAQNKNIASGNESEGIKILRGVQVTINNSVVGTDPAGRANLGNALDGIRVEECANCKIGGLLKGNTIAGNSLNGIKILGGQNAQVEANLIGVVKEANNEIRKLQNELSGIVISDTFNALIQNANVISGNVEKAIDATNVTDSTIKQNFIGIDPAGTDGLGNGGNGIVLRDSSRNTIGGAFSDGNVICENGGSGIVIEGGESNAMFRNNIGIALQGLSSSRKANQMAGMILLNTTSNRIQDLNKISGNHAQGIVMRNAISNLVWGNLIGTDEASAPFGNDGDGVLISENSSYNSVGAGGPASGNVIAYNGGAGVNIDPTAGAGNVVDPNSIYGNTGLGIDIGSPGHTPNDAGDADEGPNRGQNYPNILSYGINTTGELIVSYRVDTDPSNATYPLYCEFFIADASGEGKTFLAYDYYSESDHAGSLAGRKFINLGLAVDRGWVLGDTMTTTATDADNNTSEFFPAFAPTAAGVDVSGQVADKNGKGIANAVLSLVDDRGNVRRAITNGFGYYKFHDVESGRNYVLSVSQKQYTFEPASRVISVGEELTDVDFVAVLR